MFTCRPAGHCRLLPGADQSTKVKQVYSAAEQGAEHGCTQVRGLHFQIVVASTALAAPVVVAERLRKGSARSAKGAATLIAEAIKTARAMGATGMVVVRTDSAFFSHKIVAVRRRHKARFSLAVAQRKKVRELIATIPETAWTPIKYPKEIWDEDEERWISDAEVAEVECTAFTDKAKKYRVTARLLVRRVWRLNDTHVPDGQGELFKAWRFHAVFTDSPYALVEAEQCHRAHAIVEQVFADLEDSAPGRPPSGKFTANAAWPTLAVLAHNLTRALGTLASAFRAKARTGTIRRQLLAVPARPAARAPSPCAPRTTGRFLRPGPALAAASSAPTSTPSSSPAAAGSWSGRSPRPGAGTSTAVSIWPACPCPTPLDGRDVPTPWS
ncbi:transposase [Streptomyces sp. NPDC058572]|uniref:transposase n=1 Tax=Streptomyces sp. NPDC058572 TaxID=3346546 RepID=UPI00364F8F5B